MADGITGVQRDGVHTAGDIGIVDVLWRPRRRRQYATRTVIRLGD